MFLANVATVVLATCPPCAVWMFQEAQVGWDPISLWKQMGWSGQDRRHHSVHHVRLVHRRHDRSLRWLSALPASSRAHLLPQLPAPCVKARSTKPSRLPSATRRAIWRRSSPLACRNSRPTASRPRSRRADRSLQARPRACRSHRSRRIEARTWAAWPPSVRPLRSWDCSEPWSAF